MQQMECNLFVNNLLVKKTLVVIFRQFVFLESFFVSPYFLVQLGTVNNNSKQTTQQ